ncbi:NAD(P)/FAD-dependent oxidoreductase [Candidatus Contubernalis alkaliaceticus]|uniref:NAD(P)/FAD-dependent oxidoreductase n=1 Tax=Candidatus Contubernalis alkaliaceticus TaxID=338645 RepID=UPI001F4C2EBE|nr:FAD-dependent oxidoreductase [Candidatus Contubernalis alkalaceticus]UNC91619.1 FAD-dependent oxidoreductase [Candidatus Contubernalis alkalaceticus]
MSDILILGGGIGGIVAANVLSKTLDKKKHNIKLIDQKDKHVFQSAYPHLLVNKRKPGDITRKLERLERKGVKYYQARVEGVTPEESKVITDQGPMKYDYLIISLGVEHHPETVPGFTETAYNIYNFDDLISLQKILKNFKNGKIVLFISSLPFSCPPAPYETSFLLDNYFRERGLREKIEISVFTPETSPEPLAGPKVGESVRRMMEQRNIKLTTEAKVLSLDPVNKKLNLDQGVSVEADLFLGIPSHWGPQVLHSSGLVEEGGWIKVDPTTLETDNKQIFAVGDATALRLPVINTLAPKAGIFAHYQAEVVARNIACILKGEKPEFRYTAKGL